MKSIAGKFLAVIGLVALLGSAACENIALIGREAPEVNGDEIVGEITGIDLRLNQIVLRPTPMGSRHVSTRTILYEDNTQVIYRGKEFPVSALEVGDVVALQVWNRERGSFTNLIRVQQNSRDRVIGRSETETQRIEGTIESVDPRGGVFELRDRSGANIVVSLPPNARRAIAAQVENLRRGDHVLGEGRYLSRDRFQLESLL